MTREEICTLLIEHRAVPFETVEDVRDSPEVVAVHFENVWSQDYDGACRLTKVEFTTGSIRTAER